MTTSSPDSPWSRRPVGLPQRAFEMSLAVGSAIAVMLLLLGHGSAVPGPGRNLPGPGAGAVAHTDPNDPGRSPNAGDAPGSGPDAEASGAAAPGSGNEGRQGNGPTGAPGTGGPAAATAPSAPGGVTLNLTGAQPDQIGVSAQWTAAAGNGSPVTGYTAIFRKSGVHLQTFQVGGLGAGTVTVLCGGPCLGKTINVDVEVRAANAVGTGHAGTDGYTYIAPAIPVVQFVACEYVSAETARCTASYTGTGTIWWKVDTVDGLSEGETQLLTYCPETPITVMFFASNVSGTDYRQTSTRCVGLPP